MARPSAMIAVLLVIVAVAKVGATWCHQSGYTYAAPKPACANLAATKSALWKACGMVATKVTGPNKIPAQIAANALYWYQVACLTADCDFSVMQVVKDSATWSKYDTCEHAQASYNKTFAGHSAPPCKSDAMCPAPWCHLSGYSFKKAPTCASFVTTKAGLYKACGMTATKVTGPTQIPGVVVGKNLYYYPVACNGACAPNSFQLMQVVADQATWSNYDTCEHAQKAYNTTFSGYSAAACKGDMMCAF